MTAPSASFSIDARFNGPPDSGNGGYACGVIASAIGEQVKIRLQRPVPLGKTLNVQRVSSESWEDQWQVLQDDTVIATGYRTTVPMAAPQPPSYVEALGASTHYTGFHGHSFPTCFVCGPERHRGDGLRIFATEIPGANLVAAPWLPDVSLGDAGGKIRAEFIWAALDCPGYFAAVPAGRPAVLGELAVHVNRRVHVDEPCVVIGWKVAVDGRKYRSGTALYDEDSELCAVGQATWIELAKV